MVEAEQKERPQQDFDGNVLVGGGIAKVDVKLQALLQPRLPRGGYTIDRAITGDLRAPSSGGLNFWVGVDEFWIFVPGAKILIVEHAFYAEEPLMADHG